MFIECFVNNQLGKLIQSLVEKFGISYALIVYTDALSDYLYEVFSYWKNKRY